MKQKIKNQVDKFIGTIANKSNCYIEILNIDEVLDKVVAVIDNIYNIVPSRDIFLPELKLIICLHPIKKVSYILNLNVFKISIPSVKIPIPPAIVYESSFLEENKLITLDKADKLKINLNFDRNFGERYNPIVRQFIPKNVEDLVVLKDKTSFSIPLEVVKEEYIL